MFVYEVSVYGFESSCSHLNIYPFSRIPINGDQWLPLNILNNLSTHRKNLMCCLYFPSYLLFNKSMSLNKLGFPQVLLFYGKNVSTVKQCLQFLCSINFNAASVFLFQIFPPENPISSTPLVRLKIVCDFDFRVLKRGAGLSFKL